MRKKNPLNGGFEKLLTLTKTILDNISVFQTELGVTAKQATA